VTIDPTAVAAELGAVGGAALGRLLDDDACAALVAGYDDDGAFRSTVDMGRHRFGEGQYRYFARPLPPAVEALRQELYPVLLPIARDWWTKLRREPPWPDSLDEWLAACHAAGQRRPTPLVLRYGPGDWNALHQDLYGELVFPLQVVIGLDEPGRDYRGGELVLAEQRPRAQSRATVLELPKGHGVVITTRDRPLATQRGWSAAPVRHGVSVVRSGRRHTLGIIFHDAT
jgi:hypothetical protein